MKNYSLINARKAKGLTQEQLASMMNCTKSTISNWENGYSAPKLADALKLSEILEQSVVSLFCSIEVQKTQTKPA